MQLPLCKIQRQLHNKFPTWNRKPNNSYGMFTLLMTIRKMGCDVLLMPLVVFTNISTSKRENGLLPSYSKCSWRSRRMVRVSLLWKIHSTTWLPSTDIPNRILAFSILCDLSRTQGKANSLGVRGAHRPMWLSAFANLKGTEGGKRSTTSVT